MNKKKKIILLSIMSIIVLLICIFISIVPPSAKSAYPDLQEKWDADRENFTVYLNEIYPDDGMFKKINAKRRVEIMKLLTDNFNNELQTTTGMDITTFTDVMNNVIVKDIELVSKGAYSNYTDCIITVQNNSQTDINYIKLNVYLLDSALNIIESKWTNDNSCIKAGSTQRIKTILEDGNWKHVRVEIADIRK